MTQLENDFLKSLMESDREVSSRSNQAVIKEKKTIKDFRRDFLSYMETLSQDKELDKAVSDFASGYDAKDDKLDLMGWDILNSDKRARKYVSLEDVERLSEHPSTLRRAVFKRSFLNYIECGKMEFCALQGEELIEYLMDEVFQNPDLLKKNCYVPRPDGTVGSAYADWDRCRFSSTPDAIRAKFNALVGGDSSVSVITYYGIHGVHLDIEELKAAFNRSVKEQCTVVTEGNVTGFIQDKTLSDLCSLRKLLNELEQNGRLHIYTGLAGCGKAQPVDTIIPTPDGDKLLGDLVVGDYVFDRYGNPTKVLGIFDHDSKPCFELRLGSGKRTRCCDEHLWAVFTDGSDSLSVHTLNHMMYTGIFMPDSTASNGFHPRYFIPVYDPVSKTELRDPVVDVVPVNRCDQRCIMVDNAEHLYLTNDFIVTHNTHRAIADCFPEACNNGHTLMISLSTLVAINGSQRANAFEEYDEVDGHKRPSPRTTTPCSITMFNLCNNATRMKHWVDNYNTYCIDELSQWGLEHLNTLINVAELSIKNDANLVIMGDVNQIGSFLGRGNLLYMLIHNFPVTELTENRRSDSAELINFVWGLQKTRRRDFAQWTFGTQELVDYVHRKPFHVKEEDEAEGEEEEFHTDKVKITEMAVTGSNSCAGLINMLRLEAALKTSPSDALPSFYIPTRGDWNYYSMWNDNQEWIRRRMSTTPIRVRPLENFKFGKGSSKSLEETYSKKFLRNEACIARMSSEWRVQVISEVLPANLRTAGRTEHPEMKSATISWNEFITHFAPNYATTVNKAQGLEWNDVLVVYGDVGKLDPRQGEFVPSKNYNLNGNSASQATYVALSRARTTLRIYTGGALYGRQEEPLFADHFECLKEVDGYGADAVESE